MATRCILRRTSPRCAPASRSTTPTAGPGSIGSAAQLDAWAGEGKSGVITCSALKRRYRDRILGHRSWVWLVYLDGSPELIAGRLRARRGHFMPASLLDSQFAVLEPPEPGESAIAVPIDRPVAA